MKLPGDIEKMMRDDPEIPDRYKKYLSASDSAPTPQPRPVDFRSTGRRPARTLDAPAHTSFWQRLWAILMYCPIHRKTNNEKLTLSVILWRILEGLVLRALLAPLILAVFMVIVVHYTTHPIRVQAELTPGTLGLPYRSVAIPVSDGLALDGWFIPALDPETVAALGPQAAGVQRPGVLLVHGLGHSQDSYLGLAKQLFGRGYAVLLISTRGQGASSDAPVTFGLREASDVASAVAYLRKQPGVRGDAVAAVGFGTGAIAVLRANTGLTPPLVAAVADSVWLKMDDYIAGAFHTRPEFPTENLTSFYRMSFEAITAQSLSDWRLDDALSGLRNRPLLIIRQGHERAPIRNFIQAADNLADLQIIPADTLESQNAQSDAAALKYLTTRLGQY